jgi:hypothetical protein
MWILTMAKPSFRLASGVLLLTLLFHEHHVAATDEMRENVFFTT